MLKNMITHPEIFARLYWLPCATWYKIALLFVLRLFPSKRIKDSGKNQLETFTFNLYDSLWKENELSSWSRMVVTLIKKLILNAAPESTKRFNKILLSETAEFFGRFTAND